MNKDQVDGLSSALSNMGVGVVLIGAFGPAMVPTNLRFDLWITGLISWG